MRARLAAAAIAAAMLAGCFTPTSLLTFSTEVVSQRSPSPSPSVAP